jgi:hypothetical protein
MTEIKHEYIYLIVYYVLRFLFSQPKHNIHY